MFTIKKIKILALILSSALLFSACKFGDKGPDKSPEEVVKEGINKLKEIKSGDYSFSFDGDVSTKKEGLGFKNLALNGSFRGVYDVKDLKNPKFSMLIDLKGALDNAEKDENVQLEMRFIGDKAYITLKEVTDFQGNLPMIFVEPLKSRWFSIPLPPDLLEIALAAYKDEASLTEEEKKLKELYENTMMFKNLKYEGLEKVEGVKSYKYSGSLDEEAVVKYLEEYSKISGGTGEMPKKDELNKFLGKIEMNGYIWIGKEDMTFRQMSGNFIMKDFEGADIELEIIYGVSNFGGDVKLEVPAGAKEFDPAAIFGFGGVTRDDEELITQ